MPKRSKLETEMLKGRILRSLLDRQPEKLAIAVRHLEKLYRSRNSDRKKEYRQELENIIKYLVRDSGDLIEVRTAYKALEKKYTQVSKKRAQLQDRLLISERQAKESVQIKARFQKEREFRLQVESDYGKLLTKLRLVTEKATQGSETVP